MLERLSKQHADQRNRDKPVPPELAVFHRWGQELHDAILAWVAEEDPFHDQLALDCMALVSIFGVPARSGALRDYKWGDEIKMLDDGDIEFEIGTPDAGASKNGAYAKFLLSDLTAIGQTQLLRPDLVASGLKILYEASDKTGLVFSRTANGRNQFGTARLRDAFKGQQLCIGELRRRIETDADRLLEEGTLSAEDRERVTYVSQHTVDAADRDYVQRDTASDDQPEGDNPEDEQSAGNDQPAGDDQPDGGNTEDEQSDQHPPTEPDVTRAATRIYWLPRVTTHIQRLYLSIERDNRPLCEQELTLLNMSLAMAAHNQMHEESSNEELRVMRYATAACENLNDMHARTKRRRTE
jgi:hypothetical protein